MKRAQLQDQLTSNERQVPRRLPGPFLFLDIDGVLNTWRTRGQFGRDFINPAAVRLVDDAVERSSASVVLSTSWTLVDGYRRTVNFLRATGMRADIIGFIDHGLKATDEQLDNGLCDRSVAVLAWMERHAAPGARFVCLDDIRLGGVPLVHTTDDVGVTLADTEKIIAALGDSSQAEIISLA